MTMTFYSRGDGSQVYTGSGRPMRASWNGRNDPEVGRQPGIIAMRAYSSASNSARNPYCKNDLTNITDSGAGVSMARITGVAGHPVTGITTGVRATFDGTDGAAHIRWAGSNPLGTGTGNRTLGVAAIVKGTNGNKIRLRARIMHTSDTVEVLGVVEHTLTGGFDWVVASVLLASGQPVVSSVSMDVLTGAAAGPFTAQDVDVMGVMIVNSTLAIATGGAVPRFFPDPNPDGTDNQWTTWTGGASHAASSSRTTQNRTIGNNNSNANGPWLPMRYDQGGLSVWLMLPTTVSSAGITCYFGKGDFFPYIRFFPAAATSFSVQRSSAILNVNNTSTPVLSTGVWHLITVAWDNDDIQVYVDALATVSIAHASDSSFPGEYASPNIFFQGFSQAVCGELMGFDHKVTEAEHDALYATTGYQDWTAGFPMTEENHRQALRLP